jgi:hypothetical protein
MSKILSSLIVAAFALVAVAPASAAIVAPRVAGESQVIAVATEKKKAKKQTAKKKAPAKKQVAKKAKKSAPAA